MIQLGTTVFDRSAQMLRSSAGAKIALRAQTLRVLECLVAANGAVVSKDQLVSKVWGNVAVTDDSLVQCIGEIRSAIGDGAHQVLQTEHRRGYRLVDSAAAPYTPPYSAPAPLAPVPLAPAPLASGIGTAHSTNGHITPGIAVMAFTSMDGDERSERLAMTFAGDLITELAKYKELRVIGRLSAFALRGQTLTSKEICEKLSASYIVSGQVQRNEAALQWSLELVNGHDDEIVWSERKNVSLPVENGGVDAHIGQLAGMIGGHFRDSTLRRSAGKELDSLGAYDFYKKVSAMMLRTTVESTREALRLAALAVEKYPSYAPIWRMLANTQMWDMNYCHTGQWKGAHVAEPLRAAHKAIELNALEPMAYSVLANFLVENGQFQEALFAAEHARELGPSDPFAVNFHARALLYCGQFKEALATAEASINSMPNGHPTHAALLGRILVAMGDCKTAIARLTQTLLLSPGNTQARMAIIVALHETGAHGPASDHFTKLLATTTGFDEGYFGRAWSAIPEVRNRYITALGAHGMLPEAT
jgi:TolB-like protein/DNA-binding winged helix-turn-helix (wHTH) protein/Flp pilus assembly protein TadD